MGMEKGDCGTAGQLLYTAFSPTMYHFQQRRGGVEEQQPGTSKCLFVCTYFYVCNPKPCFVP